MKYLVLTLLCKLGQGYLLLIVREKSAPIYIIYCDQAFDTAERILNCYACYIT